jgi:hypothetical protein
MAAQEALILKIGAHRARYLRACKRMRDANKETWTRFMARTDDWTRALKERNKAVEACSKAEADNRKLREEHGALKSDLENAITRSSGGGVSKQVIRKLLDDTKGEEGKILNISTPHPSDHPVSCGGINAGKMAAGYPTEYKPESPTSDELEEERESTITPAEVQFVIDKPADPEFKENLYKAFRTLPGNVRLKKSNVDISEPVIFSTCPMCSSGITLTDSVCSHCGAKLR